MYFNLAMLIRIMTLAETIRVSCTWKIKIQSTQVFWDIELSYLKIKIYNVKCIYV